ncbi:MAG TPA: enoyl-CoA hydratase/isomerase family protein [Streptosporangiaceae bacterium]|nr:enoyl-CoA hydratase/isomerase family protein [Streptosporangiaceae bacterium]
MKPLDASFETILADVGDDHVATVTLNRPARMNAFNEQMRDEFADLWRIVRETDDIHAVVLRAAEGRAFCTGVDVKEGIPKPANLWTQEDPGRWLGPKSNRVWKPVIAAVHGMAAGGAFYWLNEADIVICSEDATFFDPHVSYGMVAALEPIGLTRRIPLGEVLRIALTGLAERVTAQTALRIGLVSEVTTRDQLWPRAGELAAVIAANSPSAVQGTVRAVWESLDATRSAAMDRGLSYTQLGSPKGIHSEERNAAVRPEPRLR